MLIRRFDDTFTISIAGPDLRGTFADRTARLPVRLPNREGKYPQRQRAPEITASNSAPKG
jgi:hypothetical protein